MILREEYACPFCSDYFDIVSLCCHLDEDHPMDTINGVKHLFSVIKPFDYASKYKFVFESL